jgi:thiamine biosynthesis lipoprotein
MGCDMAVWLETAEIAAASQAFDLVEHLFAGNEQALSRFRQESELSKLNARNGQWTAVSDLMWDVLTVALYMAAVTKGRFDLTMLNALEQSGYSISYELLNGIGRNRYAPVKISFPGQWATIELDESMQAVYLPKGVRIDLGGIAKGYTAQQAVELLLPFGPCLVDAGGDLAAGDSPTGFRGWPVAVGMPWQADKGDSADLFSAWLANRSLATSGVDRRRWQMDGGYVHHLIDPSTGKPAMTDSLMATVLADDAALAESWATAILVAGSEQGMNDLLETNLAGLMILTDGRILATESMNVFIQSNL